MQRVWVFFLRFEIIKVSKYFSFVVGSLGSQDKRFKEIGNEGFFRGGQLVFFSIELIVEKYYLSYRFLNKIQRVSQF